MSIWSDAAKAVIEMAKLGDKVNRLSEELRQSKLDVAAQRERLRLAQLNLTERLVVLETLLHVTRSAVSARLLPKRPPETD